MGHEEDYIPEIVETDVATTSTKPADPSIALRRELAFHKTESARKDDIMRRHGIPAQPVPVAPVAPVTLSAGVDSRAVANEVGDVVDNKLDPFRLELSEIKHTLADLLKQQQHAGGYEVTPAGNRVDKVGPPKMEGTEASGTKPDAPTDKAATLKTENPDDMPGFGYPPSHGFDSRRWVPMTLGEAEAKGISFRRTNPDDRTSAKKKNR